MDTTALTIGTKVKNKKTGTEAAVGNITQSGLIVLTNGAALPEDTFKDFWEILDTPSLLISKGAKR